MQHLNSPRADTRAVLIVWLLFLPLPLYAGVPGSTSSINLDASGLALRGYDPVAYFETGKPMRGMAKITASYGGARYLFATKAHRKSFLNNPTKYLPQFGGFCAVVRISRMSVHGFITCQANISVDVGPRFHGMPVQDDAGRWIVSESSFGVNDC